MTTIAVDFCLCGDPRCDASAPAFDDATTTYTESPGDCPCGGRFEVAGDLNTLAERTEFLRCTYCGAESERTVCL